MDGLGSIALCVLGGCHWYVVIPWGTDGIVIGAEVVFILGVYCYADL